MEDFIENHNADGNYNGEDIDQPMPPNTIDIGIATTQAQDDDSYPLDTNANSSPASSRCNKNIEERLQLLEEEQHILKSVLDTKTPDNQESLSWRPSSKGRKTSRQSVLHGGLSTRAIKRYSETHDNKTTEESSTLIRGDIKLPESTFTLFVVASPWSPSILLAVVSASLSLICLAFSLVYCFSNGNYMNPLGLPVDVSPIVRGTQFLGVMIGVLMEDEIPQGLELLAISVNGNFLHHTSGRIHKRVIASSLLRLVVGYMYLTSLFVNVVQTDNVLEIFFDVLALQFVESIDDVIYSLAQRGFYGSAIRKVTMRTHKLQTINNERGISSRSRSHRISLLVYYLNAVVLVSGLIGISFIQHHGGYRCHTLTVQFEEKVWENAHVRIPETKSNVDFLRGLDIEEDWHLVYSYFNGIYEEDGLYDGYPRYVERNKNDGLPFKTTVGAEFVYCRQIHSWVFRHPYITSHEHSKTSQLEENENACSWLARSGETHDYDLLSVSKDDWQVWTGKVQTFELSIKCNDCFGYSDCNYHGSCNEDRRCECLDSHFGDHCQFDWPCPMLKSKVGMGCKILELDGDETSFRHMYNRPVFMQYNLSGLPSTSSNPDNTVAFLLGEDMNRETEAWFEDHALSLLNNYTIFLLYSGSRWYGSIMSPSVMGNFHNDEFLSEYHSFWEHSYKKDNTFLISEVTFDGSPAEVEFYLGSRQVEHVDLDSGLFYCMSDNECNKTVAVQGM